MGTLVVKNLPDSLHDKLRARARRNRRSVNKEVVVMLEQALGEAAHPLELSPPLELRDGHRPTVEEIEAAIAHGRD